MISRLLATQFSNKLEFYSALSTVRLSSVLGVVGIIKITVGFSCLSHSWKRSSSLLCVSHKELL